MKKVLVTGAGGFIGSHLTEKLSSFGYEVKAFVHYNSRSSWGWLDSSVCKDRIEVISGDIRDADISYLMIKGVDEKGAIARHPTARADADKLGKSLVTEIKKRLAG